MWKVIPFLVLLLLYPSFLSHIFSAIFRAIGVVKPLFDKPFLAYSVICKMAAHILGFGRVGC